jgi:hypothetical protein
MPLAEARKLRRHDESNGATIIITVAFSKTIEIARESERGDLKSCEEMGNSRTDLAVLGLEVARNTES